MRRLMIPCFLLPLALSGAPAAADQFDGKRDLLCSAFRMFECDMANGCTAVTPAELGASSSWIVNAKKKTITGTNPNAQPNDIDRVELLDGKLFMSGIQDGLPGERDGVAWSVSVNNPDGVMTIMVAGEGIGVVGLGSCVTQ
ncbi:MAG: hypothetical protein GWM88_11995 [Pseudomonadales bacterium]|nr:hypothetical protein [Pseudomonadales bacterium]NIX08678.1 hypothetical protein [Pseudomonadales bacterium]